MRAFGYGLCFCFFGLAPASAIAGELSAKFTLGRYVPDDVWLYIHGVENPERAWLDRRITDLFRDAASAGVHRDFVALLVSMLPEDVRPKAKNIADRIVGFTEQVDWFDLTGHEFVFAERFAPTKFGTEYLALCRSEGPVAAKNVESISKILEEVSRHSRSFDYVRASKRGVEVRSLRSRASASEICSPFISLVRKDDVLALVVSAVDEGGGRGGLMLRDVRVLLAGDAKGKAIASSERFRRAVSEVESPSDALVFFDTHAFLESMHGTFTRLWHQRSDDTDEAAGLSTMCKGIEALNLIDYTITSESTKGDRSTSSCVTRIQPGKEKSPLVRAFVDRRPFEKLDQFIPADATSFMVDAMVDFEALYGWVMNFVEKNVPNGPGMIEKFKGIMAAAGFDPKRDFFSWWSGEFVSVNLPAAVVTPMGGGDSVWMFRVKNSEIATAKINAALDFANAKLTARGQGFVISPAPVQSEGFRQLTQPMLAMFIRPVIGVKDGWLIAGSSPQAVDKCLAVAAGKAPSIAGNERFRKEGIKPDGAVHSLSFSDASKTGQELGQVAAMVGMMGGGIAASLPQEVPAEARKLLQGATEIMAKLAPILQRIDYYSSKASSSRYDGSGAFRSETIVTYKVPADSGSKRTDVHAEIKSPTK